MPFTTSPLERDLALALGIPLYGADPRVLSFGTKTGCRRLFADAGRAPSAGPRGPARHGRARDGALAEIRAARPALQEAIVKLNEGVSGKGNALVDLRDLPAPGAAGRARGASGRAWRPWRSSTGASCSSPTCEQLAHDGGIVEERISGLDFRSPSVQLRVTPLGDVELLSTHDQLLGGPSGQSYLGCRFPADTAYARGITAEASKIGALLAEQGVLGRFAIDFVVVRDASGAWTPYAIELNLRKGGTTHPFLTLQFLTDGAYDPVTALFSAPNGREKYLVASDHVESDQLRALTVEALFDIAVRHRMHFHQGRQTGTVFHMLSARRRARPGRADGRRRHAGAGRRALPTGGGGPAGRDPSRAGRAAARDLTTPSGGRPFYSPSSSRSAASMNRCDAGSTGAMWPHTPGIGRHSAFGIPRASYSASTGGK